MLEVNSADVLDDIEDGRLHPCACGVGRTPTKEDWLEEGVEEDDAEWADQHHGRHEEEIVEFDGGCDGQWDGENEQSERIRPHREVQEPPGIIA